MNIKYTFKRWLKYVAIIKKSVSFTKSRLGPPFATYFSNLFLTNILVPDKRNDSKYLRRWGGGMPITRIIIPQLFIYKAHFARTTIALHSKHKRCLQVTQSVLNHVSPAQIPSLFIWKQNFRRHTGYDKSNSCYSYVACTIAASRDCQKGPRSCD